MVTATQPKTAEEHGLSTPIKVGLTAAAVVGTAAGWMAFRRWHTHWGATAEEWKGSLPGDEIIPDAQISVTHAITIDAPPHIVWPWLAQIGQGRGGFYSYTALENLVGCDMVNAQKVHPEWQHLKVGNEVRLHPKYPPAKVAIVQPERHLVLLMNGPNQDGITWAFNVRELGYGKTRFIVRLRAHRSHGLHALTDEFMAGPAHFVMERKMMLTIKRLAEDLGARTKTPIDPEC